MNWKSLLHYLAGVVALAIVYHLAARLGLQLAYVQQNTSPVWPPSGIALAALLLAGMRYWPGITLGVVGGSLLTGAPLGLALGLGIANTLEALIAAFLLTRWFGFDPGIDRIRDVLSLVVAAVCGTVVSAAVGVTTLVVNQGVPLSAFFSLWTVWFIGNFLGCLVVTPLLLTGARRLFPKPHDTWDHPSTREVVLFLIALTVVTLYVFLNPSGTEALHQALIYVVFPFAIWAALRMGQIGAAATVFAVSGIAIAGTINGLGPFSHMPTNDSLVLLQTFTGVVALISLMLAASSAERRQAERTLRMQVDDLAALNDAGRHFLESVDKQGLYGSICRFVVESFGLSAAWIHVFIPKDEVAQVAAAYPPGPASPDRLAALYAARPELSQQLQAVERSRSPHVLHTHATLGQAPALLAFAALPLEYGKPLAGTLTVASEDPSCFAEERMLLLQSYCTLAAAALQNAHLFDQVRVGNAQLQALSHRLMDVQEAERIALSRELHDESSQVLAALSVNLGLLERDAETPNLVRAHAADLKRIATVVLNNLHAQAAKLRPASLDHLGLVAALQQYVREFKRQYPLDVQFETVGIEGIALPGDLQTALFRIVQESLTNIVLHAQASCVDVLLNWRNGSLILTVEDDGIGFNPDEPAHPDRLGLFGMRERVEKLGGRLVVESAPGKGTMISAEVPCGDTRPDR